MKKLVFAAMAIAGLVAAVPASAQVYLGADPGGVGVRVGPLGAGIGPRYGPHWRHRYAYAGECRVIRERFITPRGRVMFTTRRICD